MQFEKDLTSKHSRLFQDIRELLLSIPNMNETKKPRITTYSDAKGGICHLRTVPNGVDIGFLKGAMFKDEPGLLRGETRKMRVLNLTKLNKKNIQYYLKQAIRLNES